jgi:hypothetical protein
MKWHSARNATEREALLEEARAIGNVTEAAVRLGLSRQHLSRLLNDQVERDLVVVTVGLPRELVEWLDIEAVREKHRARAGRPSKRAILERLIRCAMEREG